MAEILVLYASEDRSYLSWVEQHLQQVEEASNVSYWDHSGSIWNRTIRRNNENHLDDADVLVILLSNNFLNSKLYRRYLHGQPQLSSHYHIIPLLVSACSWQQSALFQAYAEEIEAHPPLSQLKAQGYRSQEERRVHLEGALLHYTHVHNSNVEIAQEYRRREKEKERKADARRQFWERVIVILIIIGIIILWNTRHIWYAPDEVRPTSEKLEKNNNTYKSQQ